ncbi:CBM20 domain-containing protein [Chloroflexus sp.]|uniref:CBM20 domain-containing protein n=1 Tax=Chloroflexus sp. TaxID=1904827 RepID=UPI00404A88BB
MNATTYWGQNVFVVGNIPQSGNWNPAQAVPLSAATYPVWSGTVNLPANTTIEYKYIKRDGSNVVWECCNNRVITTPSSGSMMLNEAWRP